MSPFFFGDMTMGYIVLIAVLPSFWLAFEAV